MNGIDLVHAMATMGALMVVAMVILLLMIRPPMPARIERDMLHVGRKEAHLGDVLRSAVEAARQAIPSLPVDDPPAARAGFGRKVSSYFLTSPISTSRSCR